MSRGVSFGKHLISTADLSKEQILQILDLAEEFKEINARSVKKVPSLRGKTVLNVFLEPSTRTRVSFEIAAKRLSADTVNLSGSSSSIVKGESLIDMGKTLQSMSPDVVILRHSSSGACHLLLKHLKSVSLINAGDGLNEHPSQSLLELMTIRQKLGRIQGITCAFVGDVLRSRVSRSHMKLHYKLGNEIRFVGPSTLLHPGFKEHGVKIFYDLREGIRGADVVISLRMKFEYLKDFFIPDLKEYSRNYCLSQEIFEEEAKDAILLAPGPFYRGIELTSELADGARSQIELQVENGVAMRMALLFSLVYGNANPHGVNHG